MYDPFYNTGTPFPLMPPAMQPPSMPNGFSAPLWMQMPPGYSPMPFPGPFTPPGYSNFQSFQNPQNFGEENNPYPPQEMPPPPPQNFPGYFY